MPCNNGWIGLRAQVLMVANGSVADVGSQRRSGPANPLDRSPLCSVPPVSFENGAGADSVRA